MKRISPGSSPSQYKKENKMANEALEDGEGFSKEVTRFLDKKVGTEKSSAATVYSVLQDVLKKKKSLETEVSDFQRRNLWRASLYPTIVSEYFTWKEFKLKLNLIQAKKEMNEKM